MLEQRKPYTGLLVIGLISCAFAGMSNAQSLKAVGTCSVEVSGPQSHSFQAELTGKEKRSGVMANNILWGRLILEDYRTTQPRLADMMEKTLVNPRNPIALVCASGKKRVTIADFNGKVPAEEFAGKVRSWPLVANSSSIHKEGTITAGLMLLDTGMLSLTPSEAGELKITKYTEKDFEGSFQYTSKEYTVKGKFDFQLKKIEK